MPFELPAGYSEEEEALTLEQQLQQSNTKVEQPQATQEQPQEESAEPEPQSGEKFGPFAEKEIDNPVGQFLEDVTVGIIDAFSDKEADEIREERATRRAISAEKGKALEEQVSQDTSFGGEMIRALAGGVEDFAEGVVNLPGDLASLLPGVDNDFANVDFNFVRENNTEWGQNVRTLARYVVAARQATRIPGFNKLSAGKQGAALFAGRAAEGFIEDFIGSDGTGEDATIMGSTPWTQALQTSDENNPIANRALNGLEGALINAVGGRAVDAIKDLRLWNKFRSSPVGRKILPGVKQDPEAAQKALEAKDRLNALLRQNYADDGYGATLDYTRVIEQDLALRAITDARRPLNNLIEQAAEGSADIAAYLGARTRALAGAQVIDEAYNTVKYGGDPAEEVFDGLSWPALQRKMDTNDALIGQTRTQLEELDLRIQDASEALTQQSALSGRRTSDISDLQARSLNAPRLADVKAKELGIPMNLSTGQVRYIQDLRALLDESGKRVVKFPKGVTITPGRRVKGLTSENIDEFIEVLSKGQESPVRDRIITRLQNATRPGPLDESIDTIEGLNTQVKGLQAEAKAADDAAVSQRQGLEEMMREQQTARQTLKELELEREAMYSRVNGEGDAFKAKAEELKAADDVDLPPNKVDEVVQRVEDAVEGPTTRRAAMEAGAEADQLIPTRPRAEFDAPVRAQSDVGTARTTKSSLTEANIRSLARDVDEFVVLKNLAGKTARAAGRTDAEILEQMGKASDELFSEIKELTGDELDAFIKSDTRFGTMMRDSIGDRFILTVEGREAINKLFRQTMIENKELAQNIHNQMKEGAAEVQMNLERLNERFLMMLNFIKADDAAKGDNLRSLGVIADNSGMLVDPRNQKAFQQLVDQNKDVQARQEATYNALLGIGDLIRTNPKAAARRLSRAIDTMAFSHNIPEAQINVIRAITAANFKNLDGLYINAILSGPATQSRNFWGNFYQATGHPMLAMMGSTFAGKYKQQVRHEAVAAFGATMETFREITDIIPRLWNDNVKGIDFDNPNYMIWDEELTKKMAKVMELDAQGKLNGAEKFYLGTAVTFHKFLGSPFMQPMMRAMGTVDNFFQVIAGRQTIAKRAVVDALDMMGDRPLTGKGAEEFAKYVEQFKKQHELEVFDGDSFTLIDPEAQELAKVFTFQTDIKKSDKLSQGLNSLAQIPGAKLLGLTFIKTPSVILKASLNLTPGVSSLMKNLDDAYKNGTPYYRAMRDGQEAMSLIIAGTAGFMGSQGVLTGAGPLNAEDNKKWRLAGNKPFTLTLPGGIEINYQGLEPATTVIGLFADTGQLGMNGELDTGAFAQAIASNIINKSYLAQVASAAEILSTQGGGPEDVFANIARGIVPYSGMRSQVGKLLDPYVREHRSKMEATWSWYLKKNGGLGSTATLPARPDPLTGEELTRDGFGAGGGNLLALANMLGPLGIRFSKNRTDAVHKKLFDIGVNIDEEMRSMRAGGVDVDLTNDQMVEYETLKAADGKLRKELLDYFNSEQYLKFDKPATDEQLAAGLDESETDAYKAAVGIIRDYGNAAKLTMQLGETKTSQDLQQRLDAAIKGKLEIDDRTLERKGYLQR